jgi:NAD+ synthase
MKPDSSTGTDNAARQRAIVAELHVASDFDAETERERRVRFLAEYLSLQGLRTYVLGISGGVDSSAAGRLAQLAVERLRATGREAHFVAMRLPYGEQHVESDAQRALGFIQPDETLVTFTDEARQDFVLGNIKARQRMIAQYAVAAARHGLVIGTDHAAESVMGFFTKFGDGGADLLPLFGLNKRRVRALAAHMGAAEAIWRKIPTADLETLTPQKPDEDSYGITYEDIDDFLEGKPVSERVYTTVFRFYDATRHKRALPVTLYD